MAARVGPRVDRLRGAGRRDDPGVLRGPWSAAAHGRSLGRAGQRAPRACAPRPPRIKHFLRDNGVACGESDTPQLGPRQSPAARAATLSVGVLCG